MRKTFILLAFFLLLNSAHAASVIRDEEIETSIHEIALPIIKAANLDAKEFKIYILQDQSVNAFTMGGNSIFINTGLIEKFTNPYVLQGVIAHEIGHILANHVPQKYARAQQANNLRMASIFLGVIGGIASKNGDVLNALVFGSMSATENQFYAYSRTYENEADNIALDLLQKAKSSNEGLLILLKTLSEDDRGLDIIPYTRTHPMGSWRVAHVMNYSANKKQYDSITQNQKDTYKRAIAKLKAFTTPLSEISTLYKDGDDIISKYTDVIVKYRQNYTKDALLSLEKIIALEPTNPYFIELKGQINFEHGNFKEAYNNYKLASNMLKKSYLIKTQLAISAINLAQHTKNNTYYIEAIRLLNQVKLFDNNNVMLYHFLSLAYGKLSNFGDANLAIAEKYYLLGDKEKTLTYAAKALKNLPTIENPSTIKAKDLISLSS